MTMPAEPQSELAHWWGMADESQRAQMLREGETACAELFQGYCDSLEELLGVRNKPPKDRVKDYETRPGPQWALLAEVDPAAYKEQTEDWRKLTLSGIRADMVTDITGPLLERR